MVGPDMMSGPIYFKYNIMSTIIRINRGIISQTGIIPESLSFIQDARPLEILETKSTISESSGSAGRPVLKITGVFQKADQKNQNGRIYPYDVIKQAVEEISEDVTNRRLIGEYDHPSDAKLHLDRISHVVTKLWMEGKTVYGVAEVLEDMPCGKMLADLIRNKIQIGISSRGVGEMEEIVTETAESLYKVKPGYTFIAWDVVATPSVKEAVMHVMESRDRMRIPSRSTKKPEDQLLSELNKYLNNKSIKK